MKFTLILWFFWGDKMKIKYDQVVSYDPSVNKETWNFVFVFKNFKEELLFTRLTFL